MTLNEDEKWMQHALEQARIAYDKHEVPIGAVIVRNDEIVGRGYNEPIGASDPTAHAEVQAIRAAAKQQRNYRLPDTTLYVTIEPCTMCLGAIMHARIKRVVFGAVEPKAGVVVSQSVWQQQSFFNHVVQWDGGVLEQECSALLTAFFKQRRAAKKALKNN